MTTRTDSIQIAASPHEVFGVLSAFADPPPFASIQLMSERCENGAVYEVRGRALGLAFARIFTIDAWEPPRSLGFSSVGRDNLWFRVSYDLEPLPAGTTVSVRISVKAKGRWRFVRPLLGGAVEKAARDAVVRAKAHSETRALLPTRPWD